MPLRSAMRSNKATRRLSPFSINWPKRRKVWCTSCGGLAVAMRLMNASGILTHQRTSDGVQKKKGGRDREGLGFTPARLRAVAAKRDTATVHSSGPSCCSENETHLFAVLFPAISNHLSGRCEKPAADLTDGQPAATGRKSIDHLVNYRVFPWTSRRAAGRGIKSP